MAAFQALRRTRMKALAELPADSGGTSGRKGFRKDLL